MANKKRLSRPKIHKVRFLHGKGSIIEIDGVKYRKKETKTYKKYGVEHYGYTEFEPFDYDEHKEILKEIALKLKDKVPPERVIEELFKSEKTENLRRLSKKIDKGEIRAKTTDGCLGITLINRKKKKSIYFPIAD
jgi:hypothetical protein